MLAGVLPCTANDPAVIVSVTAHVVVELPVQAGSVAADTSLATKPKRALAIRTLASATLRCFRVAPAAAHAQTHFRDPLRDPLYAWTPPLPLKLH